MVTYGVELPWLLRRWRRMRRLAQSCVASELYTTKSMLSMWEHGQRRPSHDQIWALDECYQAGGALAGLARAVHTPDGLPARQTWAHNFGGRSRPIWAWLRPQPGERQIQARARWGGFTFACSHGCDDQGIFLTAPVSVPDPATWVDMAKPGWVDFGHGEIPDRLGIPVIDAFSRIEVAPSGHSPLGLVASRVIDAFDHDERFREVIGGFLREHDYLFPDVHDTAQEPGHVLDLTTGISQLPGYEPFTGQQFRRLRVARGLSLAEAARWVSCLLPTAHVTDDQIRRLELGARSRGRWLRSRLDQIYGADGWTGAEEVPSATMSSPYAFTFPDFWSGPVWFMFAPRRNSPAQRPDTRVMLRWDGSRKHLLINRRTTVTCRLPIERGAPFEVFCPADWHVTAGMGTVANGRDVNWGWLSPKSRSATRQTAVRELFDDLRERLGLDDVMPHDQLVRPAVLNTIRSAGRDAALTPAAERIGGHA